jgi:hypothetical protein
MPKATVPMSPRLWLNARNRDNGRSQSGRHDAHTSPSPPPRSPPPAWAAQREAGPIGAAVVGRYCGEGKIDSVRPVRSSSSRSA